MLVSSFFLKISVKTGWSWSINSSDILHSCLKINKVVRNIQDMELLTTAWWFFYNGKEFVGNIYCHALKCRRMFIANKRAYQYFCRIWGKSLSCNDNVKYLSDKDIRTVFVVNLGIWNVHIFPDCAGNDFCDSVSQGFLSCTGMLWWGQCWLILM